MRRLVGGVAGGQLDVLSPRHRIPRLALDRLERRLERRLVGGVAGGRPDVPSPRRSTSRLALHRLERRLVRRLVGGVAGGQLDLLSPRRSISRLALHTQASRERLTQAQRRPGRPRSCRHQMHCRRRSTRAARRLIDYGSRVGALCCAVPGSTTPSSRRSPRRGEAQRPTTPGPRRDRRRRDIETSGDLR